MPFAYGCLLAATSPHTQYLELLDSQRSRVPLAVDRPVDTDCRRLEAMGHRDSMMDRTFAYRNGEDGVVEVLEWWLELARHLDSLFVDEMILWGKSSGEWRELGIEQWTLRVQVHPGRLSEELEAVEQLSTVDFLGIGGRSRQMIIVWLSVNFSFPKASLLPLHLITYA